MKMDAWHKTLLGAVVVALALGAIAFREWLGAHDAWIKAQATVGQQQQTIQSANAEQQQLKAEETKRDQQTAAAIAGMQAQIAQLKTSQQIAAWLPKQIPTPEPVTIDVPKATKENPTPAAVATIPQPDLPALRDYVSACQVCSVELHTAHQDLASKDQQLKLAGEKLSATEKQRDAALQAAHGTFWGRLWTRTKWLAIGAGAGAALLCGSGHCR